MADLPRRIPDGVTDPAVLAEALRDVIEYLADQPKVEQVAYSGIFTGELVFRLDMASPAYVSLNDRESGTTLGLSWTRTPGEGNRRSGVKIDSVTGVSAGDSVSITGVVVGT